MATPPDRGLYLVATPIGNLGDITYRAVEVLRAVHAIYCEDTRISRRLLERYDIKVRLSVYNDFSDDIDRQRILDRLLAGEAIALISDAGMPLISDPGFKLLNAVRAADIPVTVLPGPTAFATALALSGLPPHPSLFAGFLPAKPGQRQNALKAFSDIAATLIFYESPRRAKSALADMADAFGNRHAAVLRELTKLHEQVATGSLHSLSKEIGDTIPARGEFVIVVGPPEDADLNAAHTDARLASLVAEVGLKEAVKLFVQETGLGRNAVYDRALKLKADLSDER